MAQVPREEKRQLSPTVARSEKRPCPASSSLARPPESKTPPMHNSEQSAGPRTRLVRIKRTKETIIQDCDVYIGRACNMGGWRLSTSKWANPFTIKKEGSAAAAVAKYREYLLSKPALLKDLDELHGKTLGCWCAPQVCHGDVLLSLLKEKHGN